MQQTVQLTNSNKLWVSEKQTNSSESNSSVRVIPGVIFPIGGNAN